MRTPRWARRTLAGARSPVRDSSLPAIWSWVISTARVAELLGERDGDRAADRVEQRDRRRRPAAAAVPRGRRRRRARRRRSSIVVLAAARRPSRCTARRTAPSARRRRVAGAQLDAEAWRSRRPASRRGRPSGPGDRGHAAERRRRLDDRTSVAADAQRPEPSPGRPGRRRRRRRRAGGGAGAYQSGSSVSRPARRLADAGDDRVAGVAHLARLVAADARADPRRASPARSLATRSGSAIWARVISTPSQRAGRRSRRRAHSAWPGVDDRALEEHRDVDGRRAIDRRHSSMLNPVGSWKSGRVFSTEKIAPRTTTR